MYYEGCADRLEKGEMQTTNANVEGHTKAEMEHWDTVMSEQLGDDAT